MGFHKVPVFCGLDELLAWCEWMDGYGKYVKKCKHTLYGIVLGFRKTTNRQHN